MASLITARLYNVDWTPNTGATPKLSAIRQSDKVEVLDSVSMEEVGNGFYQYEFEQYSNTELYFYSIDWEQYDWINQLDSYGNKWTRGKRAEIIIDPKAISEAVRESKIEDHQKEWTFWAIVQKPISFTDIVVEMDWLGKKIETIISKIKIPKQVNKDDLIEWISDNIDEKLLKLASELKPEEDKEDWDDEMENVLLEIKNLSNFIVNLQEQVKQINDWVEWISKVDLVEKIEWIDIEWMTNKLTENNISMLWVIGKELKSDLLDLKWSINNLFIRLDLIWPTKK